MTGVITQQMTSLDINKFKQKLSQIYLDAFTTESYSHNVGKLTEAGAIEYFYYLLSNESEGIGFLAFDSGDLAFPGYPIGFLFGMPFKNVKLSEKKSISLKLSVERCHYLAELAVDRGHRGRGVGKCLVSKYLSVLNRVLTDVVIVRTNNSDPRLLNFYTKLGFEKLDTIADDKNSGEKCFFNYYL